MEGTEARWPVGEVARAAGVTVRTLHHYDRIGLLRPALRSPSGYRGYSADDLARLQRILAYRDLGFGLDDVARLLDDPDTDPVAQLRQQHGLVVERMEHLRQVAAVLTRTMEARRMGIDLTPAEMLAVFGEHDPSQHAEEAEQRWGDTGAYRESQRRTARYTKDDWLAIRAEAEATTARLADLLAHDAPADGEPAMDAAERARRHIDRWFYPCPPAMHAQIGEMYVADERFAAGYEAVRPGLAAYVRDAIVANSSRS